jgi:hypothetical protein
MLNYNWKERSKNGAGWENPLRRKSALFCGAIYEQEEEKKKRMRRKRRSYYKCTNYATLQAYTGNVLKSAPCWDITQR